MTFDELRSRYFEELATPEGGVATLLLESAIHHTRGVSGPGIDAAGRERLGVRAARTQFAEEIERLTDFAADHSIPVRYRLSDGGPVHHAEGTEHYVWFEGENVRKITFEASEYFSQGPFGQTIEAFDQEDLEGKTVTLLENRKASPGEYLERLYLQNLLFSIENRLEAVSSLGIETTQPLFIGDRVDPSRLADFLRSFDFGQTSQLTWHSPSLEVAISDVALHNVIAVEGVVFPFDIWARRIRL